MDIKEKKMALRKLFDDRESGKRKMKAECPVIKTYT